MLPVIIPFYRRSDQLSKCVEHLRRQTIPVEIFIRDNNKDNIFFTAAINEGISRFLDTDCRYMVILNQDMYLQPNSVEAMVRFMDQHPRAGIGAPLEHLAGQDMDHVLAGGMDAFPCGVHRQGPRWQFSQDLQIHWANGSCMILRKEMIRQIGLLDENYKLICSDSDYCFTARARGWEIWCIVGAYGVHEHGVSGLTCDPAVELIKINDILYFASKWLTGDLYRRLAYESDRLNSQDLRRLLAQYQQTRTRLIYIIEKQGEVSGRSLAEMLNDAAKSVRSGQLDRAQQLCQEVLQREPGNATALHLMALTAYMQGRLEQARDLAVRAIRNDRRAALQYNTLAVILEQMGDHPKAARAYRRALKLDAGYAQARMNLANLLRADGRLDQAMAELEILNQGPSCQVGSCLLLADCLRQAGRFGEAAQWCRRALQIDQESAEAHNDLAITLKELGDLDHAIEHQQRAIQLRPQDGRFHQNMAALYQEMDMYERAIESCRAAIALAPDRPEAYLNLAIALRDAGRIEEAIEQNQRAIDMAPNMAQAHWNQAVCLLLAGRLREGWREFVWRRSLDYQANSYPHVHTQPQWDGSDLGGRRLLIYCEQGLGDAIQFVRYLPMVKARRAEVILAAWPPLVRLFNTVEGADQVVELSWTRPVDVPFDLQVSLMDLPGLFGTTLEDIPSQAPYLHPDPQLISAWAQRLQGQKFKIGIAWTGSSSHARNRHRSCPLEAFEALSQVDAARVYSLQKEISPSDKARLKDMGFEDLSDHLADLMDTAAVVANLDLVITVDTALLHLAGAMARPTWGLIGFSPDWRWMLDRTDSPWYPTLRLFRQARPGQWRELLDEVTGPLAELVRQAATACQPGPR